MEIEILLSLLRTVGNYTVICSYFVMLHKNFKVGLICKILFGLLTVPSFMYLKMYDQVALVVAYKSIEAVTVVRNKHIVDKHQS
jgi:hypothetical protein